MVFGAAGGSFTGSRGRARWDDGSGCPGLLTDRTGSVDDVCVYVYGIDAWRLCLSLSLEHERT